MGSLILITPQVKYCSENNKRLIHFSTCEVYGKTIGSFLPKDHPLRKVTIIPPRRRLTLCLHILTNFCIVCFFFFMCQHALCFSFYLLAASIN